METKIAEKINNEISSSPFPIYRMIPPYHGAAIIGVTTIEKFAEIMRIHNEEEEYKDFLDNQPDKSKILIMPGLELEIGVAISKGTGTVIQHSFETEMTNEGYLLVE